MTTPNQGKSPLTINLFGPFSVQLNGQPLPHVRSRKGHWLLALLILRHPAPVERSWVAGTLWDWDENKDPMGNLRMSLKELRRALGPERARLLSPTSHTLALDLEGAHVDVLAFDAAIARGDPASLEKAAALYRGPLLEDCTEEWVLLESRRRQEEYLGALETLAEQAQRCGELTAAERYWRQAIAIDPTRETAQQALMSLFAGSGNFAAATETYNELRRRLHNEFNLPPAPGTTALYQQIRTAARHPLSSHGGPSLAAPRASAVAHVRSFGQVDAAPSPDSVTQSPRRAVPHNLPLQPTRFIGRERELAEIKDLLAEAPLVTLTGTGGVGKTRLALRVGSDLLKQFTDGVWMVDLAPVTDPALVPQAMASVLRVREEPGRPLTDTLTDYLRSRCLLLILDNCEHLLQKCCLLAEAVLRTCPAVRVLATSRERLAIGGEQSYRVPSLSLPDVRHTPAPDRLAEYEAIRLFLDRARLIEQAFALTEANALSVAEVCHRLDGIPLALELAAAWTNMLSIEEIRAGLDDRFRLLTRGSRTALRRQRTLGALIDWSYDLLADPERLLLCRLSVFAGGFTREAAEAVCAGDGIDAPEIMDTLAQLVDKSLVIADARGGKGQYSLLETIREYGRQRLEECGEYERMQERHARYFVAVTLARDGEEPPWLDRLEREHDNLRAAMARLRDHRDAETLLRMGTAMARLWYLRGYWSEGRERLSELLSLPALCPHSRAMLLRQAGQLAWLQADYDADRFLLGQSLALYRELDSTEDLPAPLNALGEVARTQGDYATACAYFEQSRQIPQARGDRGNLAWALQALGEVAQERGDPAARPLIEESLALFREVNDERGIASALSDLGVMAAAEGDLPSARALQEQSRTIAEDRGHKRVLARCLERLGDLAARRGDYESAASLHRQCLALRRDLGDRQRIATSLERLAGVTADEPTAAAKGTAPAHNCERAARWLGAAEALRERLGAPLPPAERPEYERRVSLLRDRLDAPVFAAAWAEGRAMPLEEVMDDAAREL